MRSWICDCGTENKNTNECLGCGMWYIPPISRHKSQGTMGQKIIPRLNGFDAWMMAASRENAEMELGIDLDGKVAWELARPLWRAEQGY